MDINGVLDLHMFQPKDVKDLVGDYLDECRARGLLEVRIIHGKGIGALRETVRAVLDKRSDVERYGHPGDASSWGATVVRLKPKDDGGTVQE